MHLQTGQEAKALIRHPIPLPRGPKVAQLWALRGLSLQLRRGTPLRPRWATVLPRQSLDARSGSPGNGKRLLLRDKRLREQLGLGSGKAWEDADAGEGGACAERDTAVGPRDWPAALSRARACLASATSKPPAPLQQPHSPEP